MMGYLTEMEGERMFDLFYQYLNPEIALLDPEREWAFALPHLLTI